MKLLRLGTPLSTSLSGFAAQGKRPMFRLGMRTCLAVLLVSLGVACKSEPTSESSAEPAEETRDSVTGLTATEAAEVLATVGETKITLGQYAASLARMDRFERLRYQTKERQIQLLDEMIEVEILAQEARRRGLDQDPVVQLRVQQALRDEYLQQLERSIPPAEEIPESEVRDYYEAHRAEFKEPARHRVLSIVVGRPELAAQVIEEAKNASGKQWGELAKKFSLEQRGLGPEDALELAGDLGFVSAPGQKIGENLDVPAPVRQAVFSLSELGEVYSEPVKHKSRYYIVRLGGVSSARDRSLRDAERTIRSELRRQKYLDAEKALEAELRQKYRVVVAERAPASTAPKPEKN